MQITLRLRCRGTWEERQLDVAPTTLLHAIVRAETEWIASPRLTDAACDDSRCGRCTVRINGVPGQLCRTSVASAIDRRRRISLAPLTPTPTTAELGFDQGGFVHSLVGPVTTPSESSLRESGCIACGACLDACPELATRGQVTSPARLWLLAGAVKVGETREAALTEALGPAGVANCAGAGNCTRVCPTGLPLAETLLNLQRTATLSFVGRTLRRG